MLWRQVHIALLGGLGVVVLLIPVNMLLTKKIGAITELMMKQKDSRASATTELLQQIRNVKFFAWEALFLRAILGARRKEMSFLRTRKYLDALCVYFWATTPILVSLATFSLCTRIGEDLTAAKVFTALSLFNILIFPLNAFPWVVNGMVEGVVSLRRTEAVGRLRLHSRPSRGLLRVLAVAELGRTSLARW